MLPTNLWRETSHVLQMHPYIVKRFLVLPNVGCIVWNYSFQVLSMAESVCMHRIRGSPSKNSAFLDKFFELISKFAYDKAKDLAVSTKVNVV